MVEAAHSNCAAEMFDSGAPESERRDGDCARAFYSNDFEWEALRAEIEDSPSGERETVGVGCAIGCGDNSGASVGLASSAWETFHKNHSKALFFKERRYLVKEFPELLSAAVSPTRILEVGCGTGSSVVPILRGNQNVSIYGCDCSAAALERATELVTKQAGLSEFQINSFHPLLCDISLEVLPSWLCCSACRTPFKQQGEMQDQEQLKNCAELQRSPFPAPQLPSPRNCCLGGVSIVTLIFTLSAFPLESMYHVVSEIGAVLQPGGLLLFRDYGLYDLTMLRFPPSQQVSKRLYYRKDGTLSYFFSLQVVRDLFTKAGLVEEELRYCCVQLMNRKKQLPMKRVWVHAKFRKPFC